MVEWLLPRKCRVPGAPPGGHEGGVLVGGVLPGEVTSVDDVELAPWEPLVEIVCIYWGHGRIVRSGNDLHRGLDLWQQVAEHGKLHGVGAHVSHRFDETVAVVGGEVVL